MADFAAISVTLRPLGLNDGSAHNKFNFGRNLQLPSEAQSTVAQNQQCFGAVLELWVSKMGPKDEVLQNRIYTQSYQLLKEANRDAVGTVG